MNIKNSNRILFLIILISSLLFSGVFIFYSEDKDILIYSAIGIISINLIISGVFLIYTEKKTKMINALFYDTSNRYNEKIKELKNELENTNNFLKENIPLLNKLDTEKKEFGILHDNYNYNKDILFKLEEDLDNILLNINKNNECNNNSIFQIEKLKTNLKKLNNIIANIDYNLINLDNEKNDPNELSLSFIIDNMKNIRTDLKQISSLIYISLQDYNSSINDITNINNNLLKTIENSLDELKPINKDISKYYKVNNDLQKRYISSYIETNKLMDKIKKFGKTLEYFIDNFS